MLDRIERGIYPKDLDSLTNPHLQCARMAEEAERAVQEVGRGDLHVIRDGGEGDVDLLPVVARAQRSGPVNPPAECVAHNIQAGLVDAAVVLAAGDDLVLRVGAGVGILSWALQRYSWLDAITSRK